MAPPRKIPVTVAESVRTRLESLAATAGVDLEAYVGVVLSNHAINLTLTTSRTGGRPITAVPDDLPADIDRANNVTGFVGVAKVGRLYTSRVGRQLIGRFSSAELAASVRYYALRGFRLGRGAMFAANGLPVEEAIEMAARAGFSFEASSPEVAVDGPAAASAAPSCTVCKDTGKMPIPSLDTVERPSRGLTIVYDRWWPCECPAGADIEKPEGWDVSGRTIEEQG